MFQNNQRSVLYLLHGFPSTAHLLNLPAFHAIMPSSLREGGAEQMRNTTLCYLERGDEVLMLHRVKKAADENAGKWIGVGGGFEEAKVRRNACCARYTRRPGCAFSSGAFAAS